MSQHPCFDTVPLCLHHCGTGETSFSPFILLSLYRSPGAGFFYALAPCGAVYCRLVYVGGMIFNSPSLGTEYTLHTDLRYRAVRLRSCDKLLTTITGTHYHTALLPNLRYLHFPVGTQG